MFLASSVSPAQDGQVNAISYISLFSYHALMLLIAHRDLYTMIVLLYITQLITLIFISF
jgi:hypothetical protein